MAKPSTAAERYVIDHVAAKQMLYVEEAGRIVRSRVVQILVIGIRWCRPRSPIAVIAAVVGHAFGVGVCHLIVQPVQIAFLEDCL